MADFLKPTASILFSRNIIVRDFKNRRALMFRLMNNRTSNMIEPEISVTLAITKENQNNNFKCDFFQLN